MHIDDFSKMLIENFVVFWVQIIHGNSSFSSILHPTLGLRIVHMCVLYTRLYGINCEKAQANPSWDSGFDWGSLFVRLNLVGTARQSVIMICTGIRNKMCGHTHHFPRFLHPSWKCELKYSHRLSSKSSQYGCSPVSQAQWVCIDWAGHCWLERKDSLWWPQWVQSSHLQCGAVRHPIRFDYHQKYLSMHPHFVHIHVKS